MAKQLCVIQCETRRGGFKARDLCRILIQYWTTDGTLLAEVDPLAPQYNPVTGEWIIHKGALVSGRRNRKEYPAFCDGDEDLILATCHEAIVKHSITVDRILRVVQEEAEMRDSGASLLNR